MPLTIGDRDITDIRHGDQPVEQVFAGPVEVWRRDLGWEQAGLSKTIIVPTWARYIDLIALGAGGGGSGGQGGVWLDGNGGVAGTFATRCWPVTPGQQITVTIGVGGAGGTANNLGPGSAGGATIVETPGNKFSAPGGRGGTGSGGGPGTSPGTLDYVPTRGTVRDTTRQAGGGPAGKDTVGQWPGGGGGYGGGGVLNQASPGRPGGSGILWYRFRSY